MDWSISQQRSLKTRVTLYTLAIFLIGIWSLAFYASRMLREDLQRLLGEQQFSAASFIAAEVNEELDDRLRALEQVAGRMTPAVLDNTAALQAFLEDRPLLQHRFNGGLVAYRLDGTAIAEVPLSSGSIGSNFMDVDTIAAALKEGRSTIGRPVIARALRAPVFGMTAPIRDTQGRVIGALTGVTNLAKPNFLDKISEESRYGKSGGYLLLVAPQYRLIVTASDKSRIMETLPAPGVNPSMDRFIQGYTGPGVLVNPAGAEVLAAAKGVPVAGWYVAILLPVAEAFGPVRAMQQHMLLATILLTFVAGGLTWWMLRRQLSPLLAAARTLAALSDSNQPPQPLSISRQDEIGQLIGGFNRLLETLGQREEALKESEAFKQSILDSVSAEIVVLDRDGVILAVNEPWRRFALENGVDPGKPVPGTDVGTNYLEACQAGGLALEDTAPEVRDGIRAVLDGRLPSFSMEYPCHSPKQQRWFGMNTMPLGEAVLGGVVITHTNITKRKIAEAELQALNRDFVTLLENTSDFIYFKDRDSRIRFCSQALANITGHQSWHDMVGKHDFEIFPEDTARIYYEEERPVFRDGTSILNRIDPYYDAQGNPGWVSTNKWPVFDHDGKTVIGIFGISRDITEGKQAEVELIAAKHTAETASLAKTRFLAAASHDLRQPIQAINLFNDALGRTELSEEQKRISHYLSLSVHSLGDLLNALLDISKLDAGIVKPFPVAMKAEELFHSIDAQFAPLAAEKHLRFMFYYPAKEMTVFTDPKLLLSLLGNLIGNAIKYTEQGGILVGIRRRGDRGLIQVWDTGIGIAPEHMGDIFQEYYQVGNPARDRLKGLGLGLSIVKRFAQLLNTEVKCQSHLGRGTVFEISLPLADEPPTHESLRIQQPTEAADTSSGFAGRRIVVIEDDSLVAQALQLSLASVGMHITAFANAEDALANPEIADADFYISDFSLPGSNGLQLLDAIQRLSPKPIKAVLLTGDSSVDRIKLTQASFWRVLFKPIDLPELLAIMESQGVRSQDSFNSSQVVLF